METRLGEIRFTLLIFMFVLGTGAAGSMPAVEMKGMEPAPGEQQQLQDQGIAQEGFKIKVDAALVTADVTVIGTAISELRAEDFLIYDNSIAQQVSHFSRDLFPLAVALLIDGSMSIRPYLPMLQIAALSALRRLRPEDQVALFSFAGNPTKLSNLSEDRLLIAKQINKLTIGSSTNIYDSIYDAASYLAQKAPNRRRAIILVSDNCHNVPSKHSANSARVEMLEASAALYGIKVPGDNCAEPSAQVKRIADETGGEILDVHASTSLQAALEKAMSNLRLQYTLGFSPSNPGETGSFHRLTVRMAAEDRCPGCRLLARSGYFTGTTAPLPPPNDVPTTPRDSPNKTDQLLVQRSIFTAGTTELDLTDIPLTVRTAEQTDSEGQPQLKVDLQIDSAGIRFKTVGDRHACTLHIAIFYADSKGKILDSDWRTVEGLLSEQNYHRVMTTGISYSTTSPIKAKKQILKVVVYDEKSDRVGSKLVRIR